MNHSQKLHMSAEFSFKLVNNRFKPINRAKLVVENTKLYVESVSAEN